MQIEINKGRISESLEKLFDGRQLQAIQHPEVLSALYGNEWKSILIRDGNSTFFHTIAARPIKSTEWFDVEPWLGYAGPVFSTNAPSFLTRALSAYSEICRSQGIIAELIRFNPVLENHTPWLEIDSIKIEKVKELVVVNCHSEEATQLEQFSDPCRRQVRKGCKIYKHVVLSKPENMNSFVEFYHNSLKRVKAGPAWYMSSRFFSTAARCHCFDIHAILDNSEWASVSLVLTSGEESYYLLAANREAHPPGANDTLIHKISHYVARKGARHLHLGGGNTSDANDPLLRFKRRFSNSTRPLMLGKLVHDREVYEKLCKEAERIDPSLKSRGFFLKYRLVPQYGG